MTVRRKYLLTFLGCMISVLLLLIYFGFFDQIDTKAKYKMLSDATAIPGISLLSISALMYISATGFFDIFGYGVSRLSLLLIPKTSKNDQNYYDYKQSKIKTRYKKFGFVFQLGAIFTAFSLIFIALYYF